MLIFSHFPTVYSLEVMVLTNEAALFFHARFYFSLNVLYLECIVTVVVL